MRVIDGSQVDNGTVRELEHASIRAFVEECRDHLTGDVLDYGCGQQPYRDVIPGSYHGYDRQSFPANVSRDDVGDSDPLKVYDRWDAILCNQVIQYVHRPLALLVAMRFALKPHGSLVFTGPTNWAEVEPQDLHRYTLTGVRQLVEDAGYLVERCDARAAMNVGGFQLSLGWGVLARRPS